MVRLLSRWVVDSGLAAGGLREPGEDGATGFDVLADGRRSVLGGDGDVVPGHDLALVVHDVDGSAGVEEDPGDDLRRAIVFVLGRYRHGRGGRLGGNAGGFGLGDGGACLGEGAFDLGVIGVIDEIL